MPVPQGTTNDLAQKIHDAITKILQDQEKEKAVRRGRKALEELDRMIRAILRREVEYPALKPVLQRVSIIITVYQNYVVTIHRKPLVSRLRHGFGGDPTLNKLLLELEESKEELGNKLDMQCIMLLTSLEKKARPSSQHYSNADLSQLIEHDVDGWHPTKPTLVGISSSATVVNLQYFDDEQNEIRVRLRLANDFRTACDGLAEYFSCCCRTIEETFPNCSTKDGEIKLETDPNSSSPVILWVFQNIYLRIELFIPERKNAHHEQITKQFYDFANTMFQHIRDGMVLLQMHRSSPIIFYRGDIYRVWVTEKFNVKVDVCYDGKYYEDVKYDGRYALQA
ncbi:hypothetical protein F5Y10DRAFT_272298 [Nemania abortiva]|nr:hypothetical protein F5Y10DRAFT_272298 [Nemania abortiva]